MAVIKAHSVAEILAHNAEALNRLRRSLILSQGQFSLVIVACNYARLRDILLEALQNEGLAAQIPVPLRLNLDPQTDSLRATIRQTASDSSPSGVLVVGLERLQNLKQVLAAANQVRDDFRQQFNFPVVLWANDLVLQHLNHFAPDFKTFAGTPIRFEFPPGELLHSLHKEAHHLFQRVLNEGSSDYLLPNAVLALESGSRLRSELEFALSDLAVSGESLDPQLEASLAFIRGRDAHANREMEVARQFYERSLQYWQEQAGTPEPDAEKQGRKSLYQSWRATHTATPHPDSPTALEKEGCLLFHLGLWWRSYAVLQWSTYLNSCEQARHYFLESLIAFQEAERLDLVARFVPAYAEVLQKLGIWDELEDVALAALELHHLYPDAVRQARDRGFLAEVALANQNWQTAIVEADRALAILNAADAIPSPNWIVTSHRGWYHFLLGEAQTHLGQAEAAIANLEVARQQTHPQYDLTLYLKVLSVLRQGYFERGDYLKAFDVKRTLRLARYRFGLEAFIGAGQIQPWQPLNPALATPNLEQLATDAIAASGRQQDVARLLERIERTDYKLTIIHGQSGVGKSSVLNAGLVPLLQQQGFLESRQIVPMMVQNYVDWPSRVKGAIAPLDLALAPETSLLELLQSATAQNYFIVLLFDQFEEFFFTCPKVHQRQTFWQFFTACLNLPYVKLVLSLREDYLHYLLEAERLVDPDQLDIINQDILSKDVRYPLGNFSPQEAKAVIEALTTRSQFYLDNDLIETLVADLAAEMNQVRPIELQVVGAELQAEDITTLAEYQALGEKPKAILVERFLNQAINDCGPEHTRLAELILFFLTEEGGIRPLKTRTELEADLAAIGLEYHPEHLNLVLEILIGSGLVFEIPALPSNRYQLVHDYLVNYIRQQQTPDWMEDLRTAKEQQKLAEARQQLAENYAKQYELLARVGFRKARTALILVITLATVIISVGFLLLHLS